MNSTHHPSEDLVKGFANGNLDSTLSCVVSAHLENCPACKTAFAKFERAASEELFEMKPAVSAQETHEAWQSISSQLKLNTSPVPVQKKINPPLVINGENFELPSSLSKLDTSNVKWLNFGKTGKITKLTGEGKRSLYLIFLGANEEVPEHSHQGTEFNYVVAGSFGADGTQFETGDFCISGSHIKHAPKALSADGCLLLSCVEGRLNFMQGFLKPFNGLLWWFLNSRFQRM